VADPADDDRKFEIALRVTGREVVALSLFSSTASQRWLWMSLGALLAVAVGFVAYGADIGAVYRGFTQ
jgi:hypothetical protein